MRCVLLGLLAARILCEERWLPPAALQVPRPAARRAAPRLPGDARALAEDVFKGSGDNPAQESDYKSEVNVLAGYLRLLGTPGQPLYSSEAREKGFLSTLSVAGETFAGAWSRTKKGAEQQAACTAVASLRERVETLGGRQVKLASGNDDELAPYVHSARVELVDNAPGLARAQAALAAQHTLALDAEWELDRRGISTLQVATREVVWVFDAQTLGRTAFADLCRALFLGPKARRQRRLGFAFDNDAPRIRDALGVSVDLDVLDLQLAAATVLGTGGRVPGLGRVAAALLARRLDKTVQCSDWAMRPLEAEQVRYAAADARILFDLLDALEPECLSLGYELEDAIGLADFEVQEWREKNLGRR